MEPSWTLTELTQRLARHSSPESAKLLALLPQLLGADAPATPDAQAVQMRLVLYADAAMLRQLALDRSEAAPDSSPAEVVRTLMREIAARVTASVTQSLTGQLTAALAIAFPGMIRDPAGFDAAGLPDPTALLGVLEEEIPGFGAVSEPPNTWRPDFN